jgi:hypothetical protein
MLTLARSSKSYRGRPLSGHYLGISGSETGIDKPARTIHEGHLLAVA